ncbi:MAG: DUF2797 domain-containing protein [Thermoplasmata archaeon]|nr:DUF2797 domain-containing protein [Thermoplasmata archaeon]
MRNHAISFYWQDFEPRLNCFDSESEEIFDFDFWPLDIAISHHVRCVGSWPGGEYVPCPTNARVSGGNQCQDCAAPFIPVPDCIFEPRCDGELCDADFCRREHAVYLAFHGQLAKVGLTSSKRLIRRAVEQGCDAYAVIARIKGRRSARNMESAISDRLALRQRIRAVESLAFLTEPVPVREIESEFTRLADTLEKLGHKPSRLKWLEHYPLVQPLERMPKLVDTAGLHRGRALGLKGKFLIFENNGLKAVNMQYLPGRHITRAAAIA